MAQWTIETFAGNGEPGYSGDGGPALAARLNNPFDLAFDARGNLWFSDTFNHCVRRVDATSGIIVTVAGTGEKGFAGDGGPARQALLNEPYGIVLDRARNAYVADRLNARVRRIDAARGVIETIAGDGSRAFGGDDGPAVEAGLIEPNGLALDPEEKRLFVADVADHRVRAIDLAQGTIATFAGTGTGRHAGDAGPAGQADLFGARAVAVDSDGTVYVLERQGSTLRAVDPVTGLIRTVAGTGEQGFAGDGGDAREAAFDRPKEMTLTAEGDILIVDTERHRIRRIERRSWVIGTIGGCGRSGPAGDGGPGDAAELARPHGVCIGPDGAIYIGDSENHRIRRLIPQTR